MKLIYPAIFTRFDDGTGYTVEFPDLPGCVTEGKNLIEAIEMAEDAAAGWVLDEMEEGRGYPAASAPSSITAEAGTIINMIILDLSAYSEKYGMRAVRRNVTLPAWLDTYAQKNRLSLSKVLQDSLLTLSQS